MALRILLLLTLLAPCLGLTEETTTLAVQNPEHFRIRRLTPSGLLVNSWESMPDEVRFEVPTRFIVRDGRGNIQLEPTLEVWRSESRPTAGNPVTHPPIGTCSYGFPSPETLTTQEGCDFYPFRFGNGETRYVALRYMAREAENTELTADDYRYETQEIRGSDGEIVGEDRIQVYNRSRFFEVQADGSRQEIPKPVDLATGSRPDPIVISNVPGRNWVRDEDDLSDVPTGRITCSQNTGDPFQCMMCNCHHESNFVYENGSWRTIGYEGRYAVAASVKTRVGMDTYPDTICDVIWFRGVARNTGRMTAHYTWTLDGEGEEVVEGENYQRCYNPVRDVLEGLNEHFASHYHTPGVRPGWRCYDEHGNPSQGRYIDGHIFYDTCDRRSRATPETMPSIEVSQ